MPGRAENLLLDRVAVDGVAEGLPHLELVEGRLGDVEEEVVGAEVADRGVDLLRELRPAPRRDRPAPGICMKSISSFWYMTK